MYTTNHRPDRTVDGSLAMLALMRTGYIITATTVKMARSICHRDFISLHCTLHSASREELRTWIDLTWLLGSCRKLRIRYTIMESHTHNEEFAKENRGMGGITHIWIHHTTWFRFWFGDFPNIVLSLCARVVRTCVANESCNSFPFFQIDDWYPHDYV